MIKIEHLVKNYGTNCAVDDISFEVESGEIVGFLGPNGAGKSTTMNILTGYLSSTSGKASIAGIDILRDPIGAKKLIGYLPEQPPLYLDMTVEEYRAAAINAVKQLSLDVGIPADLKDIVKESDLDFLSESAYADACRPGNPRETSVEEIKALYKSLL